MEKHTENNMKKYFFRASAEDFKKIPGSPIAYWIQGINLFEQKKIGDYFISGGRNKTHNNEKYLRFFWEVSNKNEKWYRYANGGDFRKYFGNELNIVDWSEEAKKNYDSFGGLLNPRFWFKEGITWSLITSSRNSFRIKPDYQFYSSGSPTIFSANFECDFNALAFLNSPISYYYIKALNPTLNTTVNDVFGLPFLTENISGNVKENIKLLLSISKTDWDSYETSWDFSTLALILVAQGHDTLATGHWPLATKQATSHWPLATKQATSHWPLATKQATSHWPLATSPKPLAAIYPTLRSHWLEMCLEMQRLEEENNRIFIDAYGLQDELSPEVPLSEITLTCNPHYRYGGERSDEELEALLLADTMRELVSYAVGCMFGRYSLDKPGLILANQGEGLEDYLVQVPEPVFSPTENNVIPILDDDWFADDICERFKQFLQVAFGVENYQENLQFIEKALNIRGRRNYSIRDYFLREFYADHQRRYKKRPIYWLFRSPRGSFNALIYMHRYRPDTVSIVLNEYLREFIAKLYSEKNKFEKMSTSADSSKADRAKALKEVERIDKIIAELEKYEKEIIYPLAIKNIEIDLDDGVKVNYEKFGKALK